MNFKSLYGKTIQNNIKLKIKMLNLVNLFFFYFYYFENILIFPAIFCLKNLVLPLFWDKNKDLD